MEPPSLSHCELSKFKSPPPRSQEGCDKSGRSKLVGVLLCVDVLSKTYQYGEAQLGCLCCHVFGIKSGRCGACFDLSSRVLIERTQRSCSGYDLLERLLWLMPTLLQPPHSAIGVLSCWFS
ncbi:hypothetical protein U1Q18_013516, partial [Sarracenia purpurea var. burkii]